MGGMSSDKPGPRPRQVTVGGSVVAVASALLVVTVFDSMTNLRSIDTRTALTRALTTGSGRDLGISVDDALTLIRAALFVAGAGAAVTAVLGIFVLQRHTAARVVLTVAAVPVVVTAPFSGGLLGAVIGGATALLWTRPARDWFAGRAVTPPEQGLLPPPPAPAWPAYPPPPAPASGRVPTPVRIACILTWVFSLLTGSAYVLVVVAVAVDRGKVLDLLRDNASVRDTSLTDSQLIGVLVAISAVVVLWCLLASLFALLTWHRHEWAWRMLLVSVGAASFVELLGLPYSLLHLAACITAFVLLLRPGVRAWLRQGRGAAAPPPPPEAQSWPPPTPRPPDKPPLW
jgi:hypothetical protein